jgi:hypothetical protein
MSIAGLTFGAILVVVMLLWILLPFWRLNISSFQNRYLEKQRERVLLFYERVLTNIRDLDEDFATGKVNEDEYRYEREGWVLQGIQLLKMLDQVDGNVSLLDDAQADEAEIDALIEQQVIKTL